MGHNSTPLATNSMMPAARNDPKTKQQITEANSSLQIKHKVERGEPLKNAIAGACAGALAKSAVAPIERVKLLLQLQSSLVEQRSAIGNAFRVDGSPSAWEVTRNVYTNEGLLAFWRGNAPNVIRQAGTAAMNFMLMDHYKRAVLPIMDYTLALPSKRSPGERKKRRSLISSFLSGGLAGGTTTTVLYPVDFLRTRLAMDVGSSPETRRFPRGMRDVLCSTLKTDGIKGIYQGYGIALAGVVLYRALHLGGYDACKTEIAYWRRGSESTELTMAERFCAAQFISIVAGTICYPIDSVRRRLMMQAGLPMDQRRYINSIDCFRKVWKVEGVRGFYLGIGPNLVRSFGGSLLLVGYDVFKGMIY